MTNSYKKSNTRSLDFPTQKDLDKGYHIYYGYDHTTNPFGPDYETDPYIKYNNKGEIIESRGSPFEYKKILERIKAEKLFPFDTKKKKKSYYKPVAGRKKLSPGKKARAENQGSTEFEMELVNYLSYFYQHPDFKCDFHTFRSPASKTPVDVWCLISALSDQNTIVKCYQCKTTKDTKPPKIITKEFNEFVAFVNKINATGYWADRWKKNKNVYIRRIRRVDWKGEIGVTTIEDFSQVLKMLGPS